MNIGKLCLSVAFILSTGLLPSRMEAQELFKFEFNGISFEAEFDWPDGIFLRMSVQDPEEDENEHSVTNVDGRTPEENTAILNLFPAGTCETPKTSGCSGVIIPSTGEILIRPSGTTVLTTPVVVPPPTGQPPTNPPTTTNVPTGRVPRVGGHTIISEVMKNPPFAPRQPSDIDGVGFTIFPVNVQGTIKIYIEFESGINSAHNPDGSRTAPPTIRTQIISVVGTATGLEVITEVPPPTQGNTGGTNGGSTPPSGSGGN